MKLILNEEQNYLKETAFSFVSEKTPVSHLRGLRDSDDQLCWDKEIWSEMVKLGWSGILIPEEYGGSNFGLTGMSVILQECGKNSHALSIVCFWSFRRNSIDKIRIGGTKTKVLIKNCIW